MDLEYRATDENWTQIQNTATRVNHYSSCILELRARVEALEAKQQTGNHLIVHDTPAPASLVEMVARLIANFASDGADLLPGDDATPVARAAVRLVAGAVIDWHDSDQLVRTGWEAGKWLEREAGR